MVSEPTQQTLIEDTHSVESAIKSYSIKEASALGINVFRLLDALYNGIHHMHRSTLQRVNWSDQYYIAISVNDAPYGTYDTDYLTRLVFLAHVFALRVAIAQSGPRHIKLEFWQRKHGMDGMYYEIHPTLDQAVEMFKHDYAYLFSQSEVQG